MRKDTLWPYKSCLEDSAYRTPEMFLLESDHLSRGFHLNSIRQVVNGQCVGNTPICALPHP